MSGARLESAEQLLARGQALEAHAELLPLAAKLSELDGPSSYRLLRALAAAAQRLGRLSEAERWLEKAAPFTADPVVRADWTLARLANSLASGAAVAEREAEAARALEALSGGEQAELMLRKAEVLASFGHPAALAAFEQAAKAAAAVGDATFEAAAVLGAARIHAGTQSYDAAERLLRDVLKRAGPELAADLWLTLGDVKFEQGDSAGAETAYRSAPAEASARVALRLAALHVQAGKLNEAEADYLAGLAAISSRDPAAAAVLDELASLYGRVGRFDEACAALQKAVSWVQVAQPADLMLEAHLRTRLGGLLLSQQQAAAAVPELQLAAARLAGEAGDRHPMLGGVLNTLAVAQLQAGALGAAQASAARALELAPDDAASALALNTLGMIEVAKGAAVEARAHFEKSKVLFEQAGMKEEAGGVQKNLAALG